MEFPKLPGCHRRKTCCHECPKNAGSAFYNYKNFHSLNLLAVCDANYFFTLVDIAGFGRDNDAALLQESQFGQAFENGELSLPDARQVGGNMLPYFLIDDPIFPLKSWLMKARGGNNLSEEERVFNYRLSRTRRTIENTLGIWAARWRIFRRPIRASVPTSEIIVKATIGLHNYTCKLQRMQ